MARNLGTLKTVAVACGLLAACGGKKPLPAPPQLPPSATWKTLLSDFVDGPLASDGRRILVATRDGVVRSLDPETGALQWKAEELRGHVSAAEGTVLVRAEDGTLSSLHPRTGALRWRVQTRIAGELPAVIDEDRALVAGRGFAAVELSAGRVLWTEAQGTEVTAPPVRTGDRLLAGEADGTLRCRDRATGASRWTVSTREALLAPPLVDARRGRAYLGTTDRRIIEISLADGDVGWRWTVGADVAQPGLLSADRVLFASHEAVLHALRPGGNLAWRSSLPSRPLSGPLIAGAYVVVACLEREVVVLDPATGKRVGSFQAASEIRTPPLVVENLLVIGLRDRSVVAYALPSAAAAAPPAVAAPQPAR